MAVLVIAVIAGVAFAALQRRSSGTRGRNRPRSSRGARRGRRVPPSDAMAAAVVEHAQVTDPAEVPAAEARLRAHAQQVASGLQAESNHRERVRAADEVDGFVDPARDPRYDDPGYDDRSR
ncbi:MAG: hypothetical protein QOD69_3488 [Solirubrobacteraceae bacterium]|nr:hypothetical protein [Solirubrobacteraceae bacterium]